MKTWNEHIASLAFRPWTSRRMRNFLLECLSNDIYSVDVINELIEFCEALTLWLKESQAEQESR